METTSLETIIRKYVALPPSSTSGGWYPVLCKVCNDHGRKGPRGGFHFEGDAVAYHCFNCGPDKNTKFDPQSHRNMPEKMANVLSCFGVPEDEWKGLVFELMRNNSDGVSTSSTTSKPLQIEPAAIELPDTFYYLSYAKPDDNWALIAKHYLKGRGIDPSSYPFMLSHNTNDKKLQKWMRRIIVPIYKDEKLIFYQGRDLTDMATKKYESPPSSKDKVLYGFDKLFEHTDAPLYIVEGWFDAYVIGGVAILGNELSQPQIEWLNRSRRRKVYIPDRQGDGQRTANKVIEQGWQISTPDLTVNAADCKDINDAVNRYGKLYVMKQLLDATSTSEFDAQIKLGLYCDQMSS